MSTFIDKFSNYNVYALTSAAKKVSIERLVSVIEMAQEMVRKPYLRFMSLANATEAMCIVYNGTTRLTRIVTLSNVENMILDGQFHK